MRRNKKSRKTRKTRKSRKGFRRYKQRGGGRITVVAKNSKRPILRIEEEGQLYKDGICQNSLRFLLDKVADKSTTGAFELWFNGKKIYDTEDWHPREKRRAENEDLSEYFGEDPSSPIEFEYVKK